MCSGLTPNHRTCKNSIWVGVVLSIENIDNRQGSSEVTRIIGGPLLIDYISKKIYSY